MALDGLFRRDPSLTLLDAYTKVYNEMSGSHPRILNQENIGGIEDIRAVEFLAP